MSNLVKIEELPPSSYFSCQALGGALMVIAPSLAGVPVGHIKAQTVHRRDMTLIEENGFPIFLPQFLLVEPAKL